MGRLMAHQSIEGAYAVSWAAGDSSIPSRFRRRHFLRGGARAMHRPVASTHRLEVAGLLISFTLMFALLAACGGSTEPVNEAPTQTETVASSTATRLENPGKVRLEPNKASPGEIVCMTGTGWSSLQPVRFDLFTEQAADVILLSSLERREIVSLGEKTPDEDGSVTLEFRLAGLRALDGSVLTIRPGQRLRIEAWQDYERHTAITHEALIVVEEGEMIPCGG